LVATELKLSDVVVNNVGGAKVELQLLCRLAEDIFAERTSSAQQKCIDVVISPISASNLATLVLGLLRAYTNSRKTRVTEDWIVNILRIYKSLLWRIENVSSHAAFFSRLFGPTALVFSLFNVPSVRKELVNVYAQLAAHRSVSATLSISLGVMKNLTKPDTTIMESRDYGTFIPVMQSLSKSSAEELDNLSWSTVLGPCSFIRAETVRSASTHIALCAAPVFESIR
jgi:hypothetical protein